MLMCVFLQLLIVQYVLAREIAETQHDRFSVDTSIAQQEWRLVVSLNPNDRPTRAVTMMLDSDQIFASSPHLISASVHCALQPRY